jgi:predicted GTPase
MEKNRRVAVYGNSLNMAGIVASLKADTTLEVLCIDLDTPDARQSLNENDLAAIVFDLSDPALRLDVSFLRDRPALVLIGVDSCKDEMLVLSSQPVRALSMADLINVIHQKELPSSSFHGEKQERHHQDDFLETVSLKRKGPNASNETQSTY